MPSVAPGLVLYVSGHPRGTGKRHRDLSVLSIFEESVHGNIGHTQSA